jgi:hypothetical protein
MAGASHPLCSLVWLLVILSVPEYGMTPMRVVFLGYNSDSVKITDSPVRDYKVGSSSGKSAGCIA